MKTRLPLLSLESGYKHTSLLFNRAFNFLFALFLLILTLPVSIVLALAIRLREGPPVFYKGERLGKDKSIFMMYKFRTLVPEAGRELKGELLGNRRDLVTGLGQFMRDTRLDEIPQLYNVLRGDMDLLGPRPERPEVYEKLCKHIPDYDRRFAAKPGLIGYSQVYTPHSAPKRIRALIDNRLVRHKTNIFWDMLTVMTTSLIVARTSLCRAVQYVVDEIWEVKIRKHYHEKRSMPRVTIKNAWVLMGPGGDVPGYCDDAELIDINDRTFCMRSDHPIGFPDEEQRRTLDQEDALVPRDFMLQTVYMKSRGRRKQKTARACGFCEIQRQNNDGTYEYVIRYEPISPFNAYMVHQHFLRRSMTQCTRG